MSMSEKNMPMMVIKHGLCRLSRAEESLTPERPLNTIVRRTDMERIANNFKEMVVADKTSK